MNTTRYKSCVLLLSALLAAGCQQNDETPEATTGTMELRLLSPGAQTSTRAQVLPQDGSLDLTARFHESDQFETTAVVWPSGRYEYLSNHPVKDVSPDGKSCTIVIGQPNTLNTESPTIYGINGKPLREYYLMAAKTLCFDASLIRTRWAEFDAPVWFEMKYNDMSSQQVQCQHLGTYEVLHIKNTSSASIAFKLEGFEAEKLWYYEKAVFLPSTRETVGGVSLPTDVTPNQAIVSVVPGAEQSVVSWYMPTGESVGQATLVATIDGQRVRSANTLTSTVKIETGHAYHLYATWDGTRLTFANGDKPASEDMPTEGLVAYYPVNGNADDASGHDNHGSATANVQLTTGINGDANGAWLFGGIDKPGHVYVKNNASLQFDTGCTFAAYVKPLSWRSMDGYARTKDSGAPQTIIAKSHDMSGVTFMLSGNNEKCHFYMQSWNNRQPWANASSADKLTGNYLNLWTHVAFVYGDGHARLYVDGQLVCDNESTPDFSTTNGQNLYIGKYSDYWYPFNGIIDEVRIYNRPLTADEVRLLARYTDTK